MGKERENLEDNWVNISLAAIPLQNKKHISKISMNGVKRIRSPISLASVCLLSRTVVTVSSLITPVIYNYCSGYCALLCKPVTLPNLIGSEAEKGVYCYSKTVIIESSGDQTADRKRSKQQSVAAAIVYKSS